MQAASLTIVSVDGSSDGTRWKTSIQAAQQLSSHILRVRDIILLRPKKCIGTAILHNAILKMLTQEGKCLLLNEGTSVPYSYRGDSGSRQDCDL